MGPPLGSADAYDQLKTITADDGKEFSLHEYAARELEIDWYFADPYSA